MAHDAFISYSSRDKTTADAACAALKLQDRCWIAPRDITPGAEWGEAIIDAIAQARALILIFSADANNSPQIRREVERAVHKGIPIVPLRIEDIAPTRSLEYFIGTLHWLGALTPPLEAHLRKLVEAVKVLLQIHSIPSGFVRPGMFPASRVEKAWRLPSAIALGCLALIVAGTAIWWIVSKEMPQPQSASSASIPIPPPAETVHPNIDPVLVGTFELDSVIDGYNWHFIYSISPDGTYRLVTTSRRGRYLPRR